MMHIIRNSSTALPILSLKNHVPDHKFEVNPSHLVSVSLNFLFPPFLSFDFYYEEVFNALILPLTY